MLVRDDDNRKAGRNKKELNEGVEKDEEESNNRRDTRKCEVEGRRQNRSG
jgi:hypothetical protein